MVSGDFVSGDIVSSNAAVIVDSLHSINSTLHIIIFLLVLFWCYERIKFSVRSFNKTN